MVMDETTRKNKINEILTRGVHEVFTKEDLTKKLESGKKLTIKLGTDVTGPTLHLGHAAIHRKIRDFQELGHQVILIIGDFTTLVGDHSDKVDMRGETNPTIIKDLEKNYRDQFFKTIQKQGTNIKHNSEWLTKLTLQDIIPLMQVFTVSQMLDRDAFAKRYKAGKPIGLDEFLYPLMQGYDSVMINADVELGATDQTFNVLAGRKLMQLFGKTPQSALVMRPLVGSDGRQMGKSLQNYIPLSASPTELYGSIMAIVDEVIFEYFELLTRIPMSEIMEMKRQVLQGENPMEFKKRLAREIVSFYHGEKTAEETEKGFTQTFTKGEIPKDAKKVIVKLKMPLADILLKQGVISSKTEFHRLIKEGAIKFYAKTEEKKIIDPQSLVEKSGALKIGKKRFLHIIVKKQK